MGYPLSQTLFTSIYINRLLWPRPHSLNEAVFTLDPTSQASQPLVHRVLRASCLGTIKACDFVHQMVCSQYYYEVCRPCQTPHAITLQKADSGRHTTGGGLYDAAIPQGAATLLRCGRGPCFARRR